MSERQVCGVAWRVSEQLVSYPDAIAAMEMRVAGIREGSASEQVWLLEHPSLYTAGTGAKPTDLLSPDRFPVFQSGRGGQFTYHGPGQRVAYAMMDLKRRGGDIRAYVHALEEWVIRALAEMNVTAERRRGLIGLWIDRGNGRADKIAAIGVRVRHWIAFHGISINVEPDLGHFEGIVPCGIQDQRLGVTSLVDLGLPVGLADLDAALEHAFCSVFGKDGPSPE